jgi:hypothetical protein
MHRTHLSGDNFGEVSALRAPAERHTTCYLSAVELSISNIWLEAQLFRNPQCPREGKPVSGLGLGLAFNGFGDRLGGATHLVQIQQ